MPSEAELFRSIGRLRMLEQNISVSWRHPESAISYGQMARVLGAFVEVLLSVRVLVADRLQGGHQIHAVYCALAFLLTISSQFRLLHQSAAYCFLPHTPYFSPI
jgi:hypothetical protein